MKDNYENAVAKTAENGSVLIVDDHLLFAEGLRLLLGTRLQGATLLHAHSAEEGLRIASEVKNMALVLLDLSLPGLAGRESIAAFRQALPECPIIVLSGSDQEGIEECSREAGATAFIHKSRSPETMLSSIAPYLPWSLKSPRQSADVDCLTPRQRDVMLQLGRGLSNKQIARELKVSENTVRVHLHEIFRLLGVASRTEAALVAINRRDPVQA